MPPVLPPRNSRGITVLALLLLILAVIALVVAAIYFWPRHYSPGPVAGTTTRSAPGLVR